ncbi:aromatic compound dioxygenase [Sporormia fimetaria CBS 119925]|uniref:Aromatic compound dioxygenase n=1 Tax=Sporormia fimetaria CBS 119925 TaxID=1340428 RepID=A0A6A6VA10_9PLEO|nr:aromatic compound dioxygenase [Sporormia fimetaria CBS 119925]
MRVSDFLTFASAVLVGTVVVAHPQLSADEMAEYKQLVHRQNEALSRCLEQPHIKELHKRAIEEHVKSSTPKSHNLQRRKRNKWVDYWMKNSQHEHVGQSPDPQDLWRFRWDDVNCKGPQPNFAGCALAPETIYGPYWIEGQLERADIRAGQLGVYMRLGMQVIDVATCKPVPNARVDIWQANSMGQYSTTNTSFLRGYQRTSTQGTVDFETNYPGHYPGRATHIHLVIRPSPNNRVVHTGMLYFDDKLTEEVEATPRYKGNAAPIVKNLDDGFAPYSASAQYDPFVQWSWLGKEPELSVLAWIAMGVNLTNNNIAQPPAPQKRSLFDDHLAH